ncbi:Glutathione synthase/RimK-type ligase, ATP-grasp superfamily [Chitinophaga costaii]|uniref:Glutathione synthase/RimK-type ligase, ATP-grasp superfamily n=1 Tax=Chitinophaga costaii TaxID=1335309 RepID=A0A1C4ERH6_9BACT|nr:hypothetical protein [Chitinophaga costaii]PUZ22545.1 hypothetical protein DCM91_14860 [Chitinophaga costaii]SCC46238.1 Glutathione synthase/RimK-type ligase, ATP-grasp superfamily [Chitinophaga costaii]
MKKIGILFGQENTFPQALVEKINSKHATGITAELVQIDRVIQGEDAGYAVIIDRISQDVPFYRSFLKNAALSGAAVINNPFWWSADEKFFNNALAIKLGVPIPKTALLPSFELPVDTKHESFRNLVYPFNWDHIFKYVGFPAYMKPFAGGGWRNVYKLWDQQDFYDKHKETGQLVMMLQEEIIYDSYFRVYVIGGEYVRIMHYDPRNEPAQRYNANYDVDAALLAKIEEYAIKLNQYLGYDFNTVEFAVRNGIPYAIDFCNPAPDADVHSVGQENFDWVVETVAQYAIARAKAQKPGQDNLTWGHYLRDAVGRTPLATEAPAKGPLKTAGANGATPSAKHSEDKPIEAVELPAKPGKKAAAPKKTTTTAKKAAATPAEKPAKSATPPKKKK